MKQLLLYLLMNMYLFTLIIILILMSVAFLTLFERKILSFMHYRKGPNKAGFMGLIQPFSDAVKLFTKEFFYPLKSNYMYYFIAPMIMLTFILFTWLIYPFKMNLISWNYNSLFILCMMSIGVYSFMLMGWSSYSNYSMLGSVRAIAQSISFEITLSITFLLILMLINNLNLKILPVYQKYIWLIVLIWPISLILMMSMLAELNRSPFDLAESESELVSGFNIEYSSHGFMLIFLAEYTSILFMMFLFNLLNFCSNLYSLMFYLKMMFLLMFIIWIRATLPRIRYDMLMFFCWIYLLSFILMLFMFYLMSMKFNLEIYFMLLSHN